MIAEHKRIKHTSKPYRVTTSKISSEGKSVEAGRDKNTDSLYISGRGGDEE
jgi:hypothetical protein